jgi:hypothetical protein
MITSRVSYCWSVASPPDPPRLPWLPRLLCFRLLSSLVSSSIFFPHFIDATYSQSKFYQHATGAFPVKLRKLQVPAHTVALYTYSPLNEQAHEIRLITLHPGDFGAKAIISIDIENLRRSKRLSYEALS